MKSQVNQRGATLVVSLIILAVITLLGVASIRSSNLELRMANSLRDRAVAFQTAEAALIQIERQLRDKQHQYSVISFLPQCADVEATINRTWGEKCFKPTCDKGFCFTGSTDGAKRRDQCNLTNSAGQLEQPWRNAANWNSAAKHSVIEVPLEKPAGGADDRIQQVRYMVEFLCFVAPQTDEVVGHDSDTSDYQPLYRITVRAEGEARRATVMLQSTLTVPDLKI